MSLYTYLRFNPGFPIRLFGTGPVKLLPCKKLGKKQNNKMASQMYQEEYQCQQISKPIRKQAAEVQNV